jgi:FkbM family methyltransferase
MPAAGDFMLETQVGRLRLDLRENICLMAALRSDPFPNETELLKRIIRTGDVVYDIGANFGWTTAVMAAAAGRSGKVHAFEPAAPALHLLRLNSEGRENVTVHGIAIGAHRSKSDFCIAEQLDLSSLTANLSGDRIRKVEQVEVWPLDQFVADHSLAKADVIKCDVEGGELNVVAGASRALSAGPLFFFEFVERFGRSNGFDFEGLRQKVLEAMPEGTQCFRVTDQGRLASSLTPASKGANNYLAVAPEKIDRIDGLRTDYR